MANARAVLAFVMLAGPARIAGPRILLDRVSGPYGAHKRPGTCQGPDSTIVPKRFIGNNTNRFFSKYTRSIKNT